MVTFRAERTACDAGLVLMEPCRHRDVQDYEPYRDGERDPGVNDDASARKL
jgi:hypothetical protein